MWSTAVVLACVLQLMGRTSDTLPAIEFVDVVPPEGSGNVEGFVRPGSGTISLVTSSVAFETARAASHRCGQRHALRKLASIIVHEEWHVRNGPDERGAYQAQLTELVRLGTYPGDQVHVGVMQAMNEVLARNSRAQSARVLASRR